MTWTHDGLMVDLAGHLRGNSERFVWTDMQLGPMHSCRPDVYTMPKVFSRWIPLAYECKVSRSDFRADVSKGKWQDYLPYAGAVIFATPAGLIDKGEVPPGCGLMQRTEKQWRTIQRPTLRPIENVPKDLWMKILLDGVHRVTQHIDPNRGQLISSFINAEAIRKKFGKDIATLIAGRAQAQQDYAYATERLQQAAKDADAQYRTRIAAALDRADKEKPEIEAVRSELCDLLGIPRTSNARAIGMHAHRQYTDMRRDSEVNRLESILSMVRHALENAERQCPALAKIDSSSDTESGHKLPAGVVGP